MDERSALLDPDGLPAVVVHQVHHDGAAGSGICEVDGRIPTRTICCLCHRWICEQHQHSGRAWTEPVSGDVPYFPCMRQTDLSRVLVDPCCYDCVPKDPKPAGYPRYAINKATSALACILVTMLLAVVVFAAT